MYSPQVLDHFEHPRHAGVLKPCDATAQVENPVCGDVLELTARVANGRIAEIRFRAKACVPAMACASALAEFAQGRTFVELAELKPEDLARSLGGLPKASTHASQLAVEALAKLVKNWHNEGRPKPAD